MLASSARLPHWPTTAASAAAGADRAAFWDDRAPQAPVTGGRGLQLTAELDDGGEQVSVVVACGGPEKRGAGLAPPDVLGAAGVGGSAG
ncbi:hypothetical protein Sxan_02910 [Streptomyces xanthophaeus]|uniref:Uncharacterized protein n=1 Tax=Streptomyces xanthophaeus TaxID=67385 RepID=A0A919GU13_9ACTN|nr:hypothetical protein Sxan_02910 [Streptomyces xanthophaeus]